MPRLSDAEKIAALEKRKTEIHQRQLVINRQMRAVRSRQSKQDRADDARRKIIAGALALEHSGKNPSSEFGRVMLRLLDEYTRPEDRRLFDSLPVQEAAPPPAPDAIEQAAE
jgi:hypothetical protein